MQSKKQESDLPDIAPLIDQALLDPHIEEEVFNKYCDASKTLGFRGLCTSLSRIPAARSRLGATSSTKLISAIAFPFGAIPLELKKSQAEWSAENGAEELDVVPNFYSLSKGDISSFGEELYEICNVGLPVTVILDMQNLTPEILNLAINASLEVGVRSLQTGNGFGRSVTKSDINKLTKIVNNKCLIKAVGGIHTIENTLSLIKAGADFIGTSNGPQLIQSIRKIHI